jgi:hypothetical protein
MNQAKIGEASNLIGGGIGAGLSYFSFSQSLAATYNLSERNLVGDGGFGYVCKVLFSRDNIQYEKVTEQLKRPFVGGSPTPTQYIPTPTARAQHSAESSWHAYPQFNLTK